MDKDEERWRRLADDVGLAEATRTIMAENPGQGDSVAELADLWEGKTVAEIYAAVRKTHSGCDPFAGPWAEVKEGANASPSIAVPHAAPQEASHKNWL